MVRWQRLGLLGLVALVMLGLGASPVLAERGGGQESGTGVRSGGGGSETALDIVQNDDLIVEGSICSSFDDACVDGEGFLGPGGLAVELKFNDSVPNMWFADTTNLDWALGHGPSSDDFQIFNDSGATKFRIEQGAPNDLLTLGAAGVEVAGKTSFSRSGMVTIAHPAKSATVTGIPVTSKSLVFATIQRAQEGVFVLVARPRIGGTSDSITIRLNKAPGTQARPRSVDVGWFVTERP